MSAYEAKGRSDEWYTPPYVFDAIGEFFDLDVAHPGLDRVNWVPAARVLTANSLEQLWYGFVWMNPPFGGRNAIVPWMEKFFEHGNGIALCPDRTSAPWWQRFARQADAVLFVSPKIRFIPGPGVVASSPGTGTTLFAAGLRAAHALRSATSLGVVGKLM